MIKILLTQEDDYWEFHPLVTRLRCYSAVRKLYELELKK